MKVLFPEKKINPRNLDKDLNFGQIDMLLGFWILILAIFLLLLFFSFNPYIKFLGLVGTFSTFFYLFFLRASILEGRLKQLHQTQNLFSLIQRLEETSLYFIERRDKDKYIFFLKDFFGKLLHTQDFLLFLKLDNTYRLFDLKYRNLRLKKKSIKIEGSLIEFLKRQSGSQILDLSAQEEYLASSISDLKQLHYQFIVSLKAREDLIGLVLFYSDKLKLTPEEEMLVNMVSNKLFWLEEIRKLKRKFLKKKKEYLSKLGQEKDSASLNQVEVKKKVFDLHSLTQVANQLFLSLNHNRLFYNFTQILQRQLNSKVILIFLPKEEDGNLKARFSKGVDFLKFADISLKQSEPLYERFRKEQFPFYIYPVAEEYQENELLARLIAQGLQLCYPLKLPDHKLGLVFLGGKAEGLRYREKDFLILSFLEDVLNMSLRNINQYNKLEELSYTDSLSGLYNYRYFCKRLNEEIFRAKRYQRKLALVIFDIDEFKTYNDSFGHQSGDQIVKQLGEEIVKAVRSIDVVCRYGGDEFCIIMPETNQGECLKFIERLRKYIQQHTFNNEFLQLKHHLTLSAGAAIYPQHARTTERLIYCSDMALLKAKSSGRNKTYIYSGEKVGVKETISL